MTDIVAPGWPDNSMLEAAWGLIANVGCGNWDNETQEWQQAARRWADAYHRQPSELSEPGG